MHAGLCAEVPDATEVVAVESAFAAPFVDQATGAGLDREDTHGWTPVLARGRDDTLSGAAIPGGLDGSAHYLLGRHG